MPKQKSVKGVKRRFKITGTGKVVAHRSGKRHLLGNKSGKTGRRLRRSAVIATCDHRSIKALM